MTSVARWRARSASRSPAGIAEARRLGYAEADPSGDIEGHDPVNKLVILARLAFDVWLDPAAIGQGADLVVVAPDDPTAMLEHSQECRDSGTPFAAAISMW